LLFAFVIFVIAGTAGGLEFLAIPRFSLLRHRRPAQM
jgi:hypothetical protein